MNLHQKFSILFYPNLSKQNKKGLVPIWVRLTIDSLRAPFSTGKYITAAMWESDNQRVKSEHPEAKTINGHLQLVAIELQRHYNILLTTNASVTADMVRQQFQGVEEEKRTFLQLFREFNSHCDQRFAVGDLSGKRRGKFKMLYGKCQEFIEKKLKLRDINLEDIKLTFLIQFEMFLRLEYKVKPNTSMKSAKDLKQVLKYGMIMEYVQRNVFEPFQSSYRPPKREVLSMEELRRIYRKNFSISRLEEVKDCFLFSCYTGYAYVDAKSLRPDNVTKGFDGEPWIIRERSKTNCAENVPLLPIALEIIDKYKSHPYCIDNNLLLPINSNRCYNAYLKEIADICGIKKRLTTHIARHTFATTVLLTNDVPMETAMELLGHTDIRTTQIYGKIVQKKISKDMDRLKVKIQSYSHIG